jgi:HD-GYP domain-containing protein (c-di-GMP phosphodiesterase class II)
LILVDLELSPGGALVRDLLATCPEARIVVLADRSQRGAQGLVDALESGAVGAIYKESDSDDLLRAVAESSMTSPVIAGEAAGLLLGAYLDAMSARRERDLAVIEALASTVEARDLVTGRHLRRVAEIAGSCLNVLDPELGSNADISYGFMLHDVGKVGIPDDILTKPGPLDDREWEIMRRHPDMGVEIVEPMGFPEATIDVIRFHHERWDGSGYPTGLEGEDIPLPARAFAAVDAFDAMTSDRPYRNAVTQKDALIVLEKGAGRHFDPDVVDALVKVVA